MTRLIDRLAAKGLVERLRSDTDRRVVRLTLTPAGEAVAAHIPQVLAEVNNAYLRGFSRDEWQMLTQLLRRMLDSGPPRRPGGAGR
jgi:DNA-binding MarR family transcriptional regulator